MLFSTNHSRHYHDLEGYLFNFYILFTYIGRIYLLGQFKLLFNLSLIRDLTLWFR